MFVPRNTSKGLKMLGEMIEVMSQCIALCLSC